MIFICCSITACVYLITIRCRYLQAPQEAKAVARRGRGRNSSISDGRGPVRHSVSLQRRLMGPKQLLYLCSSLHCVEWCTFIYIVRITTTLYLPNLTPSSSSSSTYTRYPSIGFPQQRNDEHVDAHTVESRMPLRS
ncbi:hypothetical protein F4803DRAFT_391719 [Xylaria telfairii]|nr:hypothetical protein F4803DRAFT_391719 [Xylaria telfairii]